MDMDIVLLQYNVNIRYIVLNIILFFIVKTDKPNEYQYMTSNQRFVY